MSNDAVYINATATAGAFGKFSNTHIKANITTFCDIIKTVSPYVENGNAFLAKYTAENVVPTVSSAYIRTDTPLADLLRKIRKTCGNLYSTLPTSTRKPTTVLNNTNGV